MKKIYFLAAIAVAVLASCSNKEDATLDSPSAKDQAKVEQAIGFDAYLSRANTRAITDLTAIQKSIATGGGIGVFAYYTDNDDYSGQNIPNFMWNQGVEYNTDHWEYTPVKYWPNEYGSTAISEETDRISFFAYAPYKEASPSSGKVTGATTGIVGFTRNNYAGDPMVKYVVDLDPANSVDLVWGRTPASAAFTAYDGTTYSAAALEGMPWLNVKRPANTGTTSTATASELVKFQFDHALASLNVQIDAFVDGTDATNAVDKDTRIWVRSVTFTGFTTQGALNLNNSERIGTASPYIGKALWMGINGEELVTGEGITIYDGRKDGKEATSIANNEKVNKLNAALIQSAAYENPYDPSNGLFVSASVTGVTKDAVNLFNSATANDPIYVIPTGDKVTVTIAYDVETYDGNLSNKLSDNTTPGSSISNVITKDITIPTNNYLENGKQYQINLHLGMNSVKVTAAVTDWDDTNVTTPIDSNHPTN